MTAPAEGACCPPTFSGSPLEALLQQLVDQRLDQRLRQVVREELARAAPRPAGPDLREWVRQGEAARVAGVSPSTVRAWQAAGKLTKGERGRVNLPELRALLGGKAGPSAPSPIDLRRRQLAAELVKGAK